MSFSSLARFLSELRRRRVSRVAVVYALVAWGLLQLGDILVEPLRLPEWTMSLLIVLLLLGFPVALVLAWALDITPDGIRRTPPAPVDADADPIPNAPVRLRRAVAVAGAGVLVVGGIVAYTLGRDRPGPTDVAADTPHFLAVLPFENRSSDAGNEFFADGVTDDIMTHLGQVGGLSVISRTTSMAYKHSDKSVRQIAEELGVDYVLEGSVRLVDSQVRIAARLVDAPADHHIWVDSYDRRLEDIFAVQTEIAQAIVDALEVELSPGVAARIERRPTEDLEAYNLFLVGRESYYRYDLDGTETAMELFSRALERDPDFALARAWLALAQMRYHVSDGMEAAWADSAAAGARHAIAQQPDLAAAHTALGSALTFTGRYGEALPTLERALALNPSDTHAADVLGIAYSHRGAWDEAIRVTRGALELEDARLDLSLHGNLAWYTLHLGLLDLADEALEPARTLWPGNPETIDRQGWIDLLRGNRDAALQAADRLAGFAPESPRAGLFASQLFVFAGDPARAKDAAEVTYEQSPTAMFDWFTVDVVYAFALERSGEPEQARTVLAEAERHARERIRAGDERRTFRYTLARIHALRGQTDEAFRWLAEAVDAGWNVAAITASDPLLESLRSDPRFDATLEAMDRSLAPMRQRVEQGGLAPRR